MIIAGLLAIAYLIWQPPSVDLAAQTFRADLFASHGFLIWNNDWYCGHYLPGYGVVVPALGAALGPRLAGALAAVASAALFGAIVRRRYGDRARIATLWFGAGATAGLFAGRITFVVGVAIGLAAILALQRGRPGVAAALAALTAITSPVAGLFLALSGAAVAAAGGRRAGAAALVLPAIASIALFSLMFPTGSEEPFIFSAFVAVPIFCAFALLLLPREERVLRWGVALYGIAAIAAFAIPNPVGGNMTRLGSLAGGPILALVLAGRRPLALALLALPLLWWQWEPAVRDVAKSIGDPSVHRSYYDPLLAELDRITAGEPVRVEIPPSQNRWEAAYVAPRFPLARGWLRQLESGDFELFTNGHLTAAAYKSWLADRGVAYVAESDAEPDYLSRDEEALIDRGLPYLRQVWSDDHWRLYAVRGSPGLVDGPASLSAFGPDSFSLDAARRGEVLVRFHFNRFWTVAAGDACVERAGDWTRVEVHRPGRVDIASRFSVGALLGRDRQCSA